MKSISKNGYQPDDDNIRYKINKDYFNNTRRSLPKAKNDKVVIDDDDNIRYKFPSVVTKPNDPKPKLKPKIKVNFWSSKNSAQRHKTLTGKDKEKTNRRYTIAATVPDVAPIVPINFTKPKNVVKVCKRVSFLPTPLFSENHVPMVTVPDDLTIQLNEEEANDLGADLNEAFVNSDSSNINTMASYLPKRNSGAATTNTSSRSRKRNSENSRNVISGENELEFFSKYVVQKLRKMETNQRIYSENLINTVLMLGQLGKLNGKSKITDA